jgi:hypothetical protein
MGTSPLKFQSNKPFLKFHNAFYKNLICPQGITYNPCPERCGGNVFLKDIFSRYLNNVEKIKISKF